MINRVVLVGRVTRDVEVKKTGTGLSVASFTLACDRRTGKDAQGPTADFIACVAWRQPADFLGQYAKKGAVIAVDGKLQTRNYDDKDGKKVFVTEVVCDNVRIINGQNHDQQPTPETPLPSEVEAPAIVEEPGPALDISSDDLPF